MGTVFEWDTRYETGVPEVDAEHRRLVDLINEVFDSMGHGHCNGIFKLLEQLQMYASNHFPLEVMYMQKTNYPKMDQHIWAHENFLKKLRKFHEQRDKDLTRLTIQVAVFLNEWLHTHLLDEDRKLFIHVGSIPPPNPR